MEYFFYGRDKPNMGGLRRELAEDHWSFMDRYANSMIARGPTLTTDNEEEMTGSVHIVGLPNPSAAEEFRLRIRTSKRDIRPSNDSMLEFLARTNDVGLPGTWGAPLPHHRSWQQRRPPSATPNFARDTLTTLSLADPRIG